MQKPAKKQQNLLLQEHGPFDIIGDVHGCCDELQELLQRLGYIATEVRQGYSLSSGPVFRHPQNRKAVFVGDLVDRGPCVPETLRLVHNMLEAGSALSVMGNHDEKFLRKLKGRNVKIQHGLETTMAQVEALPGEERKRFKQESQAFLETLVNHYVLDEGRLVIAHAGIQEEMFGKNSDRIWSFTLYGQTSGKTDEYGLPVRGDWAQGYRGSALIVYGHTPVTEARWVNNTVNLDTGCVFGGQLTALRYPEREIVSVPAKKVYYQSSRPFPPNQYIEALR
jgi:protein phosphatase